MSINSSVQQISGGIASVVDKQVKSKVQKGATEAMAA